MASTLSTAPQFVATGLTLNRGRTRIWEDASWNIQGYSVLLGANGAGKSSTLTMLAGQLSPDTGSLAFEIEGVNVTPEAWMRQVTLAAPWVALPSHLTLSQALDFHSTFRSPRQGELSWENLVESSGLSVHQDVPMHAWSSGQKQRLQLSLALGTESPVVLLDEPATNLDVQGIDWLHGVIAQVAALSTLVVATNDPAKEAPGQPATLEV